MELSDAEVLDTLSKKDVWAPPSRIYEFVQAHV